MVSIWNTPCFILSYEYCPFSIVPETAAAGDTFAARFAGALAASKTVTTPITIPLITPGILMRPSGILENSSPTTKRNTMHPSQVKTIPETMPIGIATRHQFNASSFTKCRTWLLLIPMHRIIPKNFVLWATLLLMLPAIIKTPASKISTTSNIATGCSCCHCSLRIKSGNVIRCFSCSLVISMRIPISTILNNAVTRKTAMAIHPIVI